MERLKEATKFIEYDLKHNFIIEPQNRYQAVKERLFDVIKTYKPKVIIKIGLGSGNLLLDIIKEFRTYTVVVEPSISAIQDFLTKNKNEDLEKLKFINGDFQNLPVDYYATDLLICIDNLNFFDSSKCIDEYKRALQFEGIFFLSTVILNNNDIEGVYDDFMKLLFPLHNDYYLEEDITTFVELKDFSLVKNIQLKFNNNLYAIIDYFQNLYNATSKEKIIEFVDSHKAEFTEFLRMNDSHEITEPYYIGFFMRKKPESAN